MITRDARSCPQGPRARARLLEAVDHVLEQLVDRRATVAGKRAAELDVSDLTGVSAIENLPCQCA